jgi:hypothetical protein
MSEARGTDPLGALHSAITFSSMDWGASADTAWIYGIAVGWDGPSMAELAKKHNWSAQKVTNLRKLRRYYRAAELTEERRRA